MAISVLISNGDITITFRVFFCYITDLKVFQRPSCTSSYTSRIFKMVYFQINLKYSVTDFSLEFHT